MHLINNSVQTISNPLTLLTKLIEHLTNVNNHGRARTASTHARASRQQQMITLSA